MERGTMDAGPRASERERAPQAPILLPAGQLAFAKLQRNSRVDRIEAGYARRAVGEIDFRARPAGIVHERHAERARHLLRCHAEIKRGDVGLGAAEGGPAYAKRRDDSLHAKSRTKSRCRPGAPASSIHSWARASPVAGAIRPLRHRFARYRRR